MVAERAKKRNEGVLGGGIGVGGGTSWSNFNTESTNSNNGGPTAAATLPIAQDGLHAFSSNGGVGGAFGLDGLMAGSTTSVPGVMAFGSTSSPSLSFGTSTLLGGTNGSSNPFDALSPTALLASLNTLSPPSNGRSNGTTTTNGDAARFEEVVDTPGSTDSTGSNGSHRSRKRTQSGNNIDVVQPFTTVNSPPNAAGGGNKRSRNSSTTTPVIIGGPTTTDPTTLSSSSQFNMSSFLFDEPTSSSSGFIPSGGGLDDDDLSKQLEGLDSSSLALLSAEFGDGGGVGGWNAGGGTTAGATGTTNGTGTSGWGDGLYNFGDDAGFGWPQS